MRFLYKTIDVQHHIYVISIQDNWRTASHLCDFYTRQLTYSITFMWFLSKTIDVQHHIFVISIQDNWRTASHWCDFYTRQLTYSITFMLFLYKSEWLLFSANSTICQLYHGENKLIFNEMMMRSALQYRATHLVGFYSASSLKQQSARIDMSSHPDTLSWFQTKHSLPFLLNAACLAEKQQIPIL
jgi:hypothetical protein